jgi:hypothetical protein
LKEYDAGFVGRFRCRATALIAAAIEFSAQRRRRHGDSEIRGQTSANLKVVARATDIDIEVKQESRGDLPSRTG